MCPDASELSAYFDGESAGSGKENLEQHIQTCSSCQAVLDSLQAQHRLLTAGAIPFPEKNSRLERLEKYAAGLNRFHRRVSVPLPWAVAAVLAVALAASLLPGQRKEQIVPLTTVVVTLTPAELDVLLTELEGGPPVEAVYTVPAELPFSRLGDPMLVSAEMYRADR